MDEHKKFMLEAIRLSEESIESGGGPFGAVVVKNGKVIGTGVNRVTIENDPTAHAEITAIQDACKNLNSFQLDDCVLYSSTEPCPMCLGAIYWARPKEVYFVNSREDAAAIGFDDSLIYEELESKHEDRKIPFIKMELQEAKKAHKLWNAKEDKKEY